MFGIFFFIHNEKVKRSVGDLGYSFRRVRRLLQTATSASVKQLTVISILTNGLVFN